MEPLSEAITFQQERAQDCFAEGKPLLEKHWAEIAHYKDISLDPEWQTYTSLEDAGFLRAYTLRDRGELKGYAVFLVKTNAHYRTSLQAHQDILYVDPEYRQAMLGARFLVWCDDQLRKEGVQVVHHHVKVNILDYGPLLKRLGYEYVDAIWAKRLDRE